MISLLKSVLAGFVLAAGAMIGLPRDADAEPTLPEDVRNYIVDLIANGIAYSDRCDIEDGLFEVVGAYPDLAIEIAGFAGSSLGAVWQIDRIKDCACPARIAGAMAMMAPQLSLQIKVVLERDFADCENAIHATLERSLSELTPDAGRGGRRGDGRDAPGPDPLAENGCRDTRNCVAPEPPASQSASATGR